MKINWTTITTVLKQVDQQTASTPEQAELLAKLYSFLYVAEGFALSVELARQGELPWEDVMPAVERSAEYTLLIEPSLFRKFNAGN